MEIKNNFIGKVLGRDEYNRNILFRRSN